MDDEQGAIQTCFHYNLKSTEGNLFFLNFILLLEAHHEFAIDPKENIQSKGKKKVRAALLVLTIYRLNKPIGFVKDRSLGSIARPKFPLKILIFVDLPWLKVCKIYTCSSRSPVTSFVSSAQIELDEVLVFLLNWNNYNNY